MADNALVEQTKGFVNRLSRLQKIVITGVVGIVVIALLVLIFSSAGKEIDYAVLYSSLDPSDASQITQSLKEKGLDYKLEDNGTKILIAKDQLYQTRLDLAGEGLPQSSVVGYELFDKTNLGMSEFVQKLNYRRALEGELSRTISAMEEVKKVRVHIVIPEKALFKKDQKPPTASV
ncbi:MAG: flagellar basal-body MS-ring/collar protein FliF, partial [Bacteroidota bacterium]